MEYVQLGVATLLSVVAVIIFYILEKRTPFAKMKYMAKQVIIGVVFGGLAVLGTEWGIPMNGAQVNCRDAAVLSAGLLFGAPAGLIAGTIGGVERIIAAYCWNVGYFSRFACSISTFLAGVYSALLRKYMFEDKKPGVLISFAIGIVMEVFHLTMVFITNMSEPDKAMAVVRACTVPMVLANAFSVMLAALAVALLSRKALVRSSEKTHISQTIQRWLLLTVAVAFLATSYFVYTLQTNISTSQRDNLLSQTLTDTEENVVTSKDKAFNNMLFEAYRIVDEFNTGNTNLDYLATTHNVTEINLVDKAGFIIDSTNPDFIGFDMKSTDQSKPFMVLNDGTAIDFIQDYGKIGFDGKTERRYVGVKMLEGFIQVGCDGVQFEQFVFQAIKNLAIETHIGETGYIIVMDEDFNVISAPSSITDKNLTDALEAIDMPDENKTFEAELYGEKVYIMYSVFSSDAYDYLVTAVYPQEEALKARNVALYVNTFMEILVFAILFVMVYNLIKRVVVNNIKKINGSLSRITEGDLSVVVNVRSNEEFASLSDDINSTVDTLKNYIAEASQRIDKELEFAKNIQSSALPRVFPAFPKRKDFDIFASMNPAKEVGGDFYDFYITHEDTLNFLIADVSGKGIPAAMFMMRAKTELKSLTEADMPLAEVFTKGNQALCEGNDAGMFVTAWQGSIDLTTGVLQFANAGHNPPLVRRNGGKFEYLRSRAGFVLAGMDIVKYRSEEMTLQPGDEVFLYTDGVTEATNANNELFGEDRLLEAINSQEFTDVKTMAQHIKQKVDEFVGDAPQFDDITMVAFRYIGTPAAPSIHFDHVSIDDIPAVTEFVETELEKQEFPMKAVIAVNVAIDEIYSNIAHYGYKGDVKGPATVTVVVKDDPKAVYVRFEDEGVPYNPLTKADPDVTLSAEERQIGGLGIYMVKKTMDDVMYRYENGKNIFTIKKFAEQQK